MHVYPASAMLVEPFLPKAWRKELDKQKTLKDDVDTDLYAIGIAEQDVAQASEEEGSPDGDDFVMPEDLKWQNCPSRCRRSTMPWTLFP